jgi:hypothetical protein
MHGTRDEEGSKDKEELAEEDVEELAVDKYGKRLDKEAQEKAFSVRPSDSDRRRGGGAPTCRGALRIGKKRGFV